MLQLAFDGFHVGTQSSSASNTMLISPNKAEITVHGWRLFELYFKIFVSDSVIHNKVTYQPQGR